MTSSIRGYHWLMLAAIPAALLYGQRSKGFFVDWSPLFAFWLVYDRLRLVQPLLYARVAVEHPFLIERAAFGWLARGAIPAHAAHSWLTAHAGRFALTVEFTAQLIYFSHLFVAPVVILVIWKLGTSRARYRAAFRRHIRAFTVLNFTAIVIYLLLPVAPPWWVSLNGFSQPTGELVSQAKMAAAMNGALIQGMISNASQWFAAVPSLHGGYPVLLFLLSPWKRRRLIKVAFALYGAAMWTSTVILNQHYIVDLVAGGALAAAAWLIVRSSLFETGDTMRIDQEGPC